MFAAALMVGCNYNDQFGMDLEGMAKPTDVKNLEYTLTADDYATISKNSTNTALAATNDESAELKALATNLYFDEDITAAEYAPAFIANKWYTADQGSVVMLTYNQLAEVPAAFAKIENPLTYTLAKADYQGVWGDEENFVMYLSPAYNAEANLPTVLTTALPNAVAGDYALVDYNFSATEPVFGGSAEEKLPSFINETFDAYETAGVNTFAGWQNVAVKGTALWASKYYNGGYIELSA